MGLLSKERLGRFTASEIHRLFMKPSITDKQLALIKILEGKKRTDLQEAELQTLYTKRDTFISTKERDNYIFEKAEEKATGISQWFTSRATEHGLAYEYEAIKHFAKLSGLNVEYGEQKFYEVGKDGGATPDFTVKNFNGDTVATGDAKCPMTTFFEQKIIFVNNLYPEYQNCLKEQFFQAQMQMKALNVNEHYLIRYLADEFEDELGNMVKVTLPIQARIFWQLIKRDNKICDELDRIIETAATERDLLVKIFKQPIIAQI